MTIGQMWRPKAGLMGGRISQISGQSGKAHCGKAGGCAGMGQNLNPLIAQGKGDVPTDEPIGAQNQNLHRSTRPATASSLAKSSGSRLSGAVIRAWVRAWSQPCGQGARV